MERILIVEDEDSIRKALKMGLASDDFEVDVAADGKKGIQKSSFKEYDILIADLCLPDMNGLEVIKEVKRTSPEIIPIVITGNGSIESSIEAIHLEVSDYLEKPLSMISVKNSIMKGIKRRSRKRKTMRNKLSNMLRIYMEESSRNIETGSDVQNPGFKQLSEKISIIVHQINNPLMAINGSAKLALLKLNNDESVKKYLTNIIESSEKIGTVNKEIIKLEQPVNDEKMELDIKILLEESLSMFKDLLFIKGVRVETAFQDLGFIVKGDRFKLEQVFKNLILNAIDSMDGKPEKLLKIDTALDKDKSMVSTYIKDTGCGIPEESMDKIFDKYFSDKEHGTGLGLTVVKDFVKEHNGRIHPKSVVGKGSTFTVSFPVSF